jgi:organic radical activating enzyme
MNLNNDNFSFEELKEYLLTKKIIIFGAGKIGKSLISGLQKISISPYEVWDNNYDKYEDEIAYEVKKPNLEILNKDSFVIIVTIYSKNISEEIYLTLLKNHFNNIIYNRNVINKVLYTQCKEEINEGNFIFELNKCHLCPVSKDIENRCDIYDLNITKNFIKKDKKISNGIKIPSMGVLVSNKCNLKCIGCNQLRDKYDSSSYLDIDEKDILNDLKKLSLAVDIIEKVVIVGGESLLHKEINKILIGILEIENIGIIQLISNGTVIPKTDEIFELLNNPRIKVEISGYGDYLTKMQNEKVQIFISKLEKYNVNFDYVKTLQWFDFGNLDKRNYSKEKWQEVYNKCCFISNDLFNGQLHKCARSAFSKHLNILKDVDYVDIRNSNIEDLSRSIKLFLENTLPTICQYCNGTSSLTIPAGKQKNEKK